MTFSRCVCVSNLNLETDAIENYFHNLDMSTDSTTLDDHDEYIQDLSLPRLSDEERDNMEGLLTCLECKKVLETFQNDVPG